MRWFMLCSLFALLSFGTPDYGVENSSYPTDYFRSPIGQTMRLAGTFGELRPNHFHSGIDIKGAIGQTLYAAADGHISRIKVEKSGFGKVIYLRHPNGYTTVYAHMNNFTPELEKYIKDNQYRKEQFEVDLFPEKDQFTFRKGQVIGAMGTTGASYGPHLHFEIRHSGSGEPINPLLFGLKVADSRPPVLQQLKVYHLNDKFETIEENKFNLVKKGGEYGVEGDVLTIGAWRAGFGLKVYDPMDEVKNRNGIYKMQLFADDELVYDFHMEKFSFSETRYLNAHLDYEEQVTNRSYFNRCYKLPGNNLSIYGPPVNQGVVKLYESRPVKITIIALDIAGNSSKLEFWVKRGNVEKSKPKVYNYVLPYDQDNVVENYGMRIFFPKGTFYENFYLNYLTDKEASAGIYSEVHSVHDYRVPVHRYFNISIRPTILPDELRSKAFIAYCEKDNRMTNYGGEWENGMLTARVRDLGDFSIMVDDTPPVVTAVNFQENMQGFSRMSFRIKDNFETAGRARGMTYRATVDGKWIVMEYDAKNDLLTHYFDGRVAPGKHEFRLIVTDGLNNATEFKSSFIL